MVLGSLAMTLASFQAALRLVKAKHPSCQQQPCCHLLENLWQCQYYRCLPHKQPIQQPEQPPKERPKQCAPTNTCFSSYYYFFLLSEMGKMRKISWQTHLFFNTGTCYIGVHMPHKSN